MSESPSCLVVFCTCPNRDIGERLAREAVEKRLVACVNMVPGVISIYEWEGQVVHEEEVLLVAKTTRQTFAALEILWNKLHPYELPEVVAVPIETGSEPYLQWIDGIVSR